jgi:hypothetical protein
MEGIDMAAIRSATTLTESTGASVTLPWGKLRPVTAVVWLLTLTLLLTALVLSESGYALVAAVGIVVAVPWFIAGIRRRLDPFEPVYILSLFWAVYYVLSPLWRYWKGEIHPFAVSVKDASWNTSLFLIALGLGAFIVGYYAKAGARLGGRWRLPKRRLSDKWMWLIAGLYAFSIGWRIYQIEQGWFFFAATTQETETGWISVLFFVGSLWTLAYAYLAVVMLGSSRTKLGMTLFFAVVVPIEVVFWFLSGYRSMVLAIVSMPLIVLWYRRRVFPAKSLAVLAVTALFVVLPANTLYRLATIDPRGLSIDPGYRFFDTLKTGFEIAWERPSLLLPFSSEEAQANFIERLEGVGTMAALLERVGYEDYLWGETLIWPVAMFVPNVLWPEKHEAYRLRQDQFCEFLNISFRPCPAVMTQLGELYWNFGAAGIIFGMFVWGFLCRAVYSACVTGAQEGAFGLWFYTAFWFRLTFIVEGGIIGQAPAISRQVAVLVGIALLDLFMSVAIGAGRVKGLGIGSVKGPSFPVRGR